MKKIIFSILFLLFQSLYTHAQSWLPVGTPGFSPGGSQYPAIAIDTGGTPYVVFEDNGDFGKASVMKFNDTGWIFVGSEGFSGGVGFFSNTVYNTSIAIDKNGTPYVAFADNGGLTVMKFNDSAWVYVGVPDFSTGVGGGGGIYSFLALDTAGVPYVTLGSTTVMKYNGSDWVLLSAPDSSAGVQYTSIAIDGSNTPYVVYSDNANGLKATVRKFTGTSWVPVGDTVISNSVAPYTSIAIDGSGTPYVVFEDDANMAKATVMKFNGSGWVSVGPPGFSDSMVIYTSIAIGPGGTPYVAYTDYGHSGKATVMKYDGTAWVAVGSMGFSASYATYITLVIDANGIPYLAYVDASLPNSGITVMRFGWPEATTNMNNPVASVTVYPNPNNGSFTSNISSPTNEEATIIITNMLGEKIKEVTTTTNTNTQIELDAPTDIYILSAVTGRGTSNVKINLVR